MNVGLIRNKKPNLNNLTGMKVCCLLLIFWWHTELVHAPINLGARADEILFLLSGFLIAYNYQYNDELSLFKQSYLFIKSRIIKFYPLHIITMVLYGLLRYRGESLKALIIDVLMLKAWSLDKNIYAAFNTAAWFLSALMFCYFVAPLLLKIAKNKNKGIILILSIVLRYLVEYLNDYLNLGINIHIFPIGHGLEFMMGIMLYELYQKYKDIKIKKVIFSILEISLTLIYIYFCVVKDSIWPGNNGTIWPRSIFVLLFLPVLFVFIYNKGILSRILSWKIFSYFNKIQFEFFLIHELVINIVVNNFEINYSLAIVVSFVLSAVCGIALKKCNRWFECKLIR